MLDHARVINDCVAGQLGLLKPVEEAWQPSDLLPDLSRADWRETVEALRSKAANLPDELLVVLVGNIVTEEALPSYQTWLNRTDGLKDETGASQTPWALWTRGWTAEENRHGEALSRYLYLSGRVDVHSVEITIQHLLRNGFDLKSDGDPYRSIVYASFQERATKISHLGTGRLAEKCGDTTLAKMCSLIAGDEARHEEAYKRLFAGILKAQPSEGIIAFADMMRQKVAMPARFMSDGTERNLFENYALAAQRSGVYTLRDYADIMGHLVEFWDIASFQGLTSEARECQEYVCGLPARYRSKSNRVEEVIRSLPKEPFKWIFDRPA